MPDLGGEQPGEFTGRYLVLMQTDGMKEGLQIIRAATGLGQVCNAADYEDGAVDMAESDAAEVLVLDQLSIAVVDTDPTQAGSLLAAEADDNAILAVEPERIIHAISAHENTGTVEFPFDYLKGYRDAVNHLYDSLTGAPGESGADFAEAAMDSARLTWGLQATLVGQSRFSGRGIRVAVLDTGLDLAHPDFAGRSINSQSFVTGEAVQDRNGHGTHCIGAAMGPKSPPTGVRRYGCAFGSEIFVGKVLSNQGSGTDRSILTGINWALTNKCRVISMSLGARCRPGDPFSQIYESIAQSALQSNPGTLIIAAAGNNSRLPNGRRQEPPNPVSHPANCPSIMAVAALDANFRIAPFSDGGINPNGGGVDIAGPGVSVFSSYPMNQGGHTSLSGTSMATPHVAGIAAMWLEARGPGTPAQALWQLLTGNARRMALPSRDVGAGLVQAPQ
ncbi:S8 family serine peptidase [uncultured Lamprocystis sp.]|uniref:S8 family peptidase n=1 Tax=uncultured Lamprocystis sp. TaxID=543132 RepID=UPI0025D79026|nr:S8 family serine peptidase [uncultured Lamprocystis sp.]